MLGFGLIETLHFSTEKKYGKFSRDNMKVFMKQSKGSDVCIFTWATLENDIKHKNKRKFRALKTLEITLAIPLTLQKTVRFRKGSDLPVMTHLVARRDQNPDLLSP